MKDIRLKLWVSIAAVFFLTAIASGIYFSFDISAFMKAPKDPGARPKTVMVQPGQGLKAIAQNLENESIISKGIYFALYAKFKKQGEKIKAGEYLLSASQSPEEILDMLVKGKVKLYRITIPEGFSIKEISTLVKEENLCDADTFLALCHDPLFIKSLGVDALSLEGYLFPDTYIFTRQNTCKDIVSTMIRRFQAVFTPEMEKQAMALGFSAHEMVTLASIIEKETGQASERPVISSVFHNRLKKNMRLESDPTVIYGIKDFDGDITKNHLQAKTPYNTYQIFGLPPGPIASPGLMSLQAALNPSRTGYLYFVSKKDSTHHFSETFQEHERAVRRYQLGK